MAETMYAVYTNDALKVDDYQLSAVFFGDHARYEAYNYLWRFKAAAEFSFQGDASRLKRTLTTKERVQGNIMQPIETRPLNDAECAQVKANILAAWDKM